MTTSAVPGAGKGLAGARRSLRSALVAALAAVAALALFRLMLGPLTRQMLYPAPPVPVPRPPAPLVEVELELSGGERAVAWWLEHEEASSPAVAFFHGNGENLETLRLSGLFEQLAALGAHVLAVDYPGYGRSTGKPSESGLTAAGEAALWWLAERHPGSKKVALGWSLGAAVAIQTAARHPATTDGLVLISAWSDLVSLAAVHYPAWLVSLGLEDRYDSVAAARDVRAPVLMIHGDADAIIPLAQGRRLYEALAARARDGGAPCRFVEVPGAGHNDLLARPEVWRELGAFLAALG